MQGQDIPIFVAFVITLVSLGAFIWLLKRQQEIIKELTDKLMSRNFSDYARAAVHLKESELVKEETPVKAESYGVTGDYV